MISEEDKKFLVKVISKYGFKLQIQKIEEEALELALAIHHYTNKKNNPEERLAKVIDELADVEIMLEQAKLMFNNVAIQERVEFKLNRLRSKYNG